ncbi:MAG TPA: hypothetical protein VMN36_15450, partial [Verrucomicrobiales bacterium]|nr:hypothetical protein [Verrucomicrobiales bacterium]
TPAGVRIEMQLRPVVSLRFTTGYKLGSLRLLPRLCKLLPLKFGATSSRKCTNSRRGQECPRPREKGYEKRVRNAQPEPAALPSRS